ncbi:MAG: phosphate ABC transporter substrate-binding protein [Eubacteriales bacterium]|nr:phosphate ABC transporter substrate-binding protein [Eubacteriales bacterium]
MKRSLKLLTIGIISSLMLVGCGGNSSPESNGDVATENGVATESNVNTEISGTITMNGSTSMEKLSNSLNEVFQSKYPNVLPTVQFTGSSAGIESVINKTVDIGNSSRALKDEEKEKGIVENIVAIDGIAVIVEPTNTVTDITKEQLINIYNGTITNWSELGGEDQGIVVIGREPGSGTRSAFEEILDLKDAAMYAQEIDSTGAVVGKVSSIPGAIGYVSLDVINDTVLAVSIDGAEPSSENIKSGAYTLSRPFVMATNGEISEQSPQVQEFFNFIYSEEGKAIIEKVGLITVD